MFILKSFCRRPIHLLTSLGVGLATVAGVSSLAADEDATDAGVETSEAKDVKDSNETKEKLQQLKLADGHLTLMVPERWKKKQPRVRIIEVELEVGIKEKKDDEEKEDQDKPAAARLTIMRAGGGIEANVDRWIGQFQQPDGSSSRRAAKIEKKEVDELVVHVVDLSGTYMERRGFRGPTTPRKDYRMLGAIISTDKAGNYFIKLIGPNATLKDNEKAFAQMTEKLKWE